MLTELPAAIPLSLMRHVRASEVSENIYIKHCRTLGNLEVVEDGYAGIAHDRPHIAYRSWKLKVRRTGRLLNVTTKGVGP